MRIIVGSLQHETNTLTPLLTKEEDFEILYGEDSLRKLAAIPLFKEAGADIIPTLYANTVPSGMVREKTFVSFRERILDVIRKELPVDGIWLYLHGAMDVENIGSGEANLLTAPPPTLTSRRPRYARGNCCSNALQKRFCRGRLSSFRLLSRPVTRWSLR